MTIKELTNILEQIAPLSYQESYDNCGLLTGDENSEVSKILVTLDCTEAVIDEAIENGCNVVVAHHPIIFSGLKKITGRNYVEKTVIKSIKNDIAIYAIHTNYDSVLHGVNSMICERLGILNPRILLPKQNENPNVGSGMIGELEKPADLFDFLNFVKEKMGASKVRYTSIVKEKVQKIAVCGGSGRFLLNDAIAANADVFISSDFKYHEFFDAENKLVIADIGHYESEQFTKDLLKRHLLEKNSTFAVLISSINTNPVNYL